MHPLALTAAHQHANTQAVRGNPARWFAHQGSIRQWCVQYNENHLKNWCCAARYETLYCAKSVWDSPGWFQYRVVSSCQVHWANWQLLRHDWVHAQWFLPASDHRMAKFRRRVLPRFRYVPWKQAWQPWECRWKVESLWRDFRRTRVPEWQNPMISTQWSPMAANPRQPAAPSIPLNRHPLRLLSRHAQPVSAY